MGGHGPGGVDSCDSCVTVAVFGGEGHKWSGAIFLNRTRNGLSSSSRYARSPRPKNQLRFPGLINGMQDVKSQSQSESAAVGCAAAWPRGQGRDPLSFPTRPAAAQAQATLTALPPSKVGGWVGGWGRLPGEVDWCHGVWPGGKFS